MKTQQKEWSAGIYEQSESGWKLVEWSRHSRRELALAAAKKYARQEQSATGGLLSWSAWYRQSDHPETEVNSRTP